MNKLFKKTSLLYNYLITYFAIFLIPLIIISITFYTNTVNQLNDEVTSTYQYKLNQISNDIQVRFTNMKMIAFNISRNSTLKSKNLTNGPYDTMLGIDELKGYKFNSLIVEDIILYYDGEDVVYTSEGRYRKDIFLTSALEFENWDNFLDDLDTINVPKVFPEQPVTVKSMERNLFTYIYPLKVANYSNQNGYVIFLVSKSLLKERLKNFVGDFKALDIYDKDNECILSLNKDNESTSDGVKVSFQDSKMGWNYEMTLPDSMFVDKSIYFKNSIKTILIATLIIGILSTILISLFNYLPIKRLVEDIKNNKKTDSEEMYKNELETIRNSVTNTIEINKHLIERMDSQKELVKKQLLYAIINGKMNDELVKIQSENLDLKEPYFSVMIISLFNNANENAKSFVLRYVRENYAATNKAYGLDLAHNNCIAMVVNLHKNDKEELRELCKGLLSACEKANIPIRIGVGNIYDAISKTNYSYLDALSAVENNTLAASQQIVFFEDIIGNIDNNYWYPHENHLRFIQSIKHANIEIAFESLEEIIENIKKKRLSFMMAKYICYDLINSVIKLIGDLKISIENDDIKYLMKFSNIEDFEARLKTISQKICDFVKNNTLSADDKFKIRVINYIADNCLNYDISLSEVAEELDVSIYYLSRFFKKHMGVTFTNYLVNLRIEKSKEILLDTNFTVKQVANQIGYINVSYFIKCFKQAEGLTPSMYRKRFIKSAN